MDRTSNVFFIRHLHEIQVPGLPEQSESWPVESAGLGCGATIETSPKLNNLRTKSKTRSKIASPKTILKGFKPWRRVEFNGPKNNTWRSEAMLPPAMA